MKLKQTIIDRLITDRPLRLEIALGLEFGEVWTDRLIAANKENGPLTTAKSLSVLRKELNLTDADILEEQDLKENASINK